MIRHPLRLIVLGVLILVVSPTQVHRPAAEPLPLPPVIPVPPFPGGRFVPVYAPAHYTPYVMYAEEVGVEAGCWSWLGETPAGRPAWLTGRTAPTTTHPMAAYEEKPHHWRVWFAETPPAPPDALVTQYRHFLVRPR